VSNEAQSLSADLGELKPPRRLISTILRHDIHHAGEIDHIRGLLAEDGRWSGGDRPGATPASARPWTPATGRRRITRV
jgi:hypothetical protein